MQEETIPRNIRILKNQAKWIEENKSFNLSGFVQDALDTEMRKIKIDPEERKEKKKGESK